jgi:hypothetical protein
VSDGSREDCPHTPQNEVTPGCAHLFAEPTLVLGGRIYLAASLRQFCLYPYPWARAAPGVSLLLLRRLIPAPAGSAAGQPPSLGPAFWAAAIPAGFEAISARLGLLSLAATDAQTRADVAELSRPQSVPCAAGAKCEACVGSCQPLPPLMGSPPQGQAAGCDVDEYGLNQSWVERTRYTVPASNRSEVLLYRNSKTMHYLCFAERSGTAADWSEPAPAAFPDSGSNINAGTLPDGRVFVLSNLRSRQQLVLSLSRDGYHFDVALDVAACTRAPFSSATQPDGCRRRNPGVGSGPQYPQAVVVGRSLFVAVSNNPEDIWVLKVPLGALGETPAPASTVPVTTRPSDDSLLAAATPARRVSYYVAPLHDSVGNATRLVDYLKREGGTAVASNLIVYCEDNIVDGVLVLGKQKACEVLREGASSLGISFEHVLNIKGSHDNNSAVRALFEPKASAAAIDALAALVRDNRLQGISWDAEPLHSTREDAIAFGAFNTRLRAALAPYGARVSAYSNNADAMIADIPAYVNGVDAVITGQTYHSARGGDLTNYSDWLGSYLAVARRFNQTVSGLPIPRKMAPALTATYGHGNWTCQPESMEAVVRRLAADGVSEFAVFLIDAADDGQTEVCSDAWVQHARAFLNGSAF